MDPSIHLGLHLSMDGSGQDVSATQQPGTLELDQSQNLQKNTPLHQAAACSNTKVVKSLLAAGADVNARSSQDRTGPHDLDGISISCLALSINIPSHLYIDAVHSPAGTNALFFAYAGDWLNDRPLKEDKVNRNIAMQLIEAGSALITHKLFNLHILHQATCYGDAAMARFLLQEKKIDPNVRDANENTPLHHILACRKGKKATQLDQETADTIRLLVEAGADIDAQNAAGKTPTQHILTWKMDPKGMLVAQLVAAGASIYEEDVELIKSLVESEQEEVLNKARIAYKSKGVPYRSKSGYPISAPPNITTRRSARLSDEKSEDQVVNF